MASCVRNIHAKNYRNLIISFQVTVENVGDVFLGHSVYIIINIGANAPRKNRVEGNGGNKIL